MLGWPHYLSRDRRQQRTNALSTAYGAKLLFACGNEPNLTERHRIAETLRVTREANGIWCASSQGSIGRPEVSAVVVSALALVGGAIEEVETSIQAILDSLAAEGDIGGGNSTCVVSTVISCLAPLIADPAMLQPAVDRLLDGVILVESERCGWGASLDGSSSVPSAVHTARAVIALRRLSRRQRQPMWELNLANATRNLIAQSRSGCPPNIEENIRRVVDGRIELLQMRHFSAAWILRALTTAPAVDPGPALPYLLRGVLESRRSDGLWWWDSADAPVWMTYQALEGLRSYASLSATVPTGSTD
jgi:hypothetical protein